MKKPFYQAVASAMEIPPDLSERAALVEITGRCALRVENYLRILTYSSEQVVLQCKNCRLEVCGKNLFIQSYTKEEISLRGFIEYVRYV